MGIPFSIEQFFSVFAQYNESVWPMQVILNLLALVAIILLYRARPLKSRVLAAVLSFLWGWMAIAYHFAFFTTINSAAWLFGAVFMAGTFWVGRARGLRGQVPFRVGAGIP